MSDPNEQQQEQQQPEQPQLDQQPAVDQPPTPEQQQPELTPEPTQSTEPAATEPAAPVAEPPAEPESAEPTGPTAYATPHEMRADILGALSHLESSSSINAYGTYVYNAAEKLRGVLAKLDVSIQKFEKYVPGAPPAQPQ